VANDFSAKIAEQSWWKGSNCESQFRDALDLKLRKKFRKSAAEVIIVLIVAVVGSLTLASYFLPSLAPFSQWFLTITPLSVAFATFYLSVSIARDRRAREMADRIYTPLLKEVTTWFDPKFQNFGEWTRLNLEAHYWLQRVPKVIANLFNEAYESLRKLQELRAATNKLISDGTNQISPEVLSKAGFEDTELGAIYFYIMTESGGGINPIYILWIWQTGKSVTEYVADYAKENFGKGTKWRLQTQASAKRDGTIKVAGETEDTNRWITQVFEFLKTQPEALEYARQIGEVRKLGEQAFKLIDEELS